MNFKGVLEFDELIEKMDVLTYHGQYDDEGPNMLIHHTRLTPEEIEKENVAYFILPLDVHNKYVELVNSTKFLEYFNSRFNTAVKLTRSFDKSLKVLFHEDPKEDLEDGEIPEKDFI